MNLIDDVTREETDANYAAAKCAVKAARNAVKRRHRHVLQLNRQIDRIEAATSELMAAYGRGDAVGIEAARKNINETLSEGWVFHEEV